MELHEIAIAQLEAESDMWAEQVDLLNIIDGIVHIARLAQTVPLEIREGMIHRQKTLIDAMMRQAFIEGAFRTAEIVKGLRK